MYVKYRKMNGGIEARRVNAPGYIKFEGTWCIFESDRQEYKIPMVNVVAIFEQSK